MSDRFVFHPELLDNLPEGSMDDGNLRDYLDDEEFSFDLYDEDGYTADTILQAAVAPESGVIESPENATLWLDFTPGGEYGPIYEFRVTFDLPVGRTLRLVSGANDYPPNSATGRDAIIEYLAEAVDFANSVLDNIDFLKIGGTE